ncbi:hypothetical protein Ddye_011690 [Dipteronia dyeriana]|uniref:Uncharacterized protein n=1 Tax=Dipteronia dyeriana TaxID=168575 RepID=A0AAE0CHE3_9ROSI|nr:hypothetical protein Ddye_011690 [Dipteronia dyeriana]
MDNNTVFMLHDSDIESTSELSDSSNTDIVTKSYQAFQLKPLSGPHVPIQIHSEKYSKPVDSTAYIDTGSHNTMMNPKILPPKYWKSHVRYFKAADDQIFTSYLISKNKIGIKIFPSCILWVHVIGTPLRDKDILIGRDVYCQ